MRIAVSKPVVAAALGLQLSCASMQDAFVSKIDEEMRIQQACSGFTAGNSEVPPGFIGDDAGADERMRVSLGVGPNSAPWSEFDRRFQEWSDKAKSEDSDSKSDNDLTGLLGHVGDTSRELKSAIETWGYVGKDLSDLVDDIRVSGFVGAMNNCAKLKLDDGDEGSCSWAGELPETKFDASKMGVLARNTEDLVRDVRLTLKDIEQIRKKKGNRGVSNERLQELEHLLAEVFAFGGVMRDGYITLESLSETDMPPAKRMVATAQLIVNLQSDRIVDVILYWIGRGIVKLEKQIAAVDDAAYGLLSTGYAVGNETKAVKAGLCRIAAFIQDQLTIAGIDRGAFGARACYALFHERELYPDSEMMTNVFRAIIFASAGACADSAVDDVDDAPSSDNELFQDPVPADVPMFQGVGQDSAKLAESLWDARVTVATQRFRDIDNIEDLSIYDLPRRDDVPAMLAASLWVSRRVNSAEIDAFQSMGDFAAALLAVQRGALELGGPYVIVPHAYICGGVDAPQFCERMESDDSTNDAIASIAGELCKQNASRTRLDMATLLCAHSDSEKAGECTPTGEGAFFDIRATFKDMEYFSNLTTATESKNALAHIRAIARVVDSYPRSSGHEDIAMAMSAQGRASSKQVAPDNARALLNAILTSEDIFVLSGKCPSLTDLQSSTGDAVEKLRAAPDNLLLSNREGFWLNETQKACESAADRAKAQAANADEQLGWVANHMLAVVRAVDTLWIMHQQASDICGVGMKCSVAPPEIQAASPDSAEFRAVTIQVMAHDESTSCGR